MIITLFILALVIASAVFPLALRFAHRHNIVDHPDARKLQKEPVPVFGGIVVLLGIIIPLFIADQYYHFNDFWYIIVSICILWLIGVVDDIRGLSAVLRFLLEMTLIWVLMWHPMSHSNGPIINNLLGLWGRNAISLYTAIPLTLIAGVGIINSINLIDGVDGYSSGYGIVANGLFAFIFLSAGYIPQGIFSLVVVAALIPFYFHNVFGRTSKMFLGDGGSLVVGMVMACNVFALLDANAPTARLMHAGISLPALALAILCIPVFDTLRVMFARLIQGHSPFHPDKTHLHHLFIDLGFSHVGTSTIIILSNLLVVGWWYLTYLCGAGITLQFYGVILAGLIVVPGFYYHMRHAMRHQTRLCRIYQRLGRASHFEFKHIWAWLQRLVDRLG